VVMHDGEWSLHAAMPGNLDTGDVWTFRCPCRLAFVGHDPIKLQARLLAHVAWGRQRDRHGWAAAVPA